jgi:uncharacterized protein YodC (DUF2158 family)
MENFMLPVGSVVLVKGTTTPPMTVEKSDAEHTVCVWFVGDVVQRESFATATLELMTAK